MLTVLAQRCGMAKNRRGSGAYSAKADARFCDQNTRKMFEAVGSKDKSIELIPGSHYLEDGPEHRHRAASIIAEW